ncbi:hypothetical protein F5Y15DRAFT_18254 [Xylariaceae sp. FL0016]|nr:hypothetical protein F5Y15DRAFT_18254 [Xylariaceae sp. FL0016]
MGNICGKSEPEAFSSPGRVLGSTPAQPTRAPVPPKVTSKSTAPALQSRSSENNSNDTGAAADARRRAAEAAEARANTASSKQSGPLGSKLAAQKKQTRNDTLQEVSYNERRTRDADEAAQARTYH